MTVSLIRGDGARNSRWAPCWVAAALAAFKVPAHVEVRTERLPRNASGKLLKNVLRGEGEVSFAETM